MPQIPAHPDATRRIGGLTDHPVDGDRYAPVLDTAMLATDTLRTLSREWGGALDGGAGRMPQAPGDLPGLLWVGYDLVVAELSRRGAA